MTFRNVRGAGPNCFVLNFGGAVSEDDGDIGGVELSEAIEALRTALVAAWWDGQGRRVRFRLEPVEFTVQAGVTRMGRGAAGVRWHVMTGLSSRPVENAFASLVGRSEQADPPADSASRSRWVPSRPRCHEKAQVTACPCGV